MSKAGDMYKNPTTRYCELFVHVFGSLGTARFKTQQETSSKDKNNKFLANIAYGSRFKKRLTVPLGSPEPMIL